MHCGNFIMLISTASTEKINNASATQNSMKGITLSYLLRLGNYLLGTAVFISSCFFTTHTKNLVKNNQCHSITLTGPSPYLVGS